MVRKPADAPGRTPDPTALQEQLEDVLDGWYVEQSPFLTAKREEGLRAAWARAVAARGAEAPCDEPGCAAAQSCEHSQSCESGRSCLGGGLPRCEAYRLVFTPIEQTEISFPDFEEELLAFRVLPTGVPAAAPSVDDPQRSVDAGAAGPAVDLETVIDFLRATQ
jgi:hypothetical protein